MEMEMEMEMEMMDMSGKDVDMKDKWAHLVSDVNSQAKTPVTRRISPSSTPTFFFCLPFLLALLFSLFPPQLLQHNPYLTLFDLLLLIVALFLVLVLLNRFRDVTDVNMYASELSGGKSVEFAIEKVNFLCVP
eukprot:759386-Hanusia_phi.AAC.2